MYDSGALPLLPFVVLIFCRCASDPICPHWLSGRWLHHPGTQTGVQRSGQDVPHSAYHLFAGFHRLPHSVSHRRVRRGQCPLQRHVSSIEMFMFASLCVFVFYYQYKCPVFVSKWRSEAAYFSATRGLVGRNCRGGLVMELGKKYR